MTVTRAHLVLLLLLALLILPPMLQAQAGNRAALVVDFGDRVATQCVAFSESEISGYELLVRAGLNVEVEAGGMGAAVCRLDDTGCPSNDCFCQCSGGDDCVYWSYWHQSGGTWQYSAVGASAYQVGDGAVEGWTWGPGSPDQAIPPPDLSFADVCAPAATATSAPSATPLPSATSPPTATPVPSIDFSVDASHIVAGSCTTLRWDVQHVQAVYLDGNGVMGDGTRQVCPTAAQTYTLRAVHGDGETVRQVTVEVAAATLTPSASPTAPPAPTATSRPANVSAETATPPAAPTVTPSATALAAEVVGQTEAEEATATVTVTSTTVVSSPPSTPTAIVITVPPLATETPAATTAAVAAVPPSTPATGEPADKAAPAASDVAWLNYAGFAVLAIALGLALVLVQRNREAE